MDCSQFNLNISNQKEDQLVHKRYRYPEYDRLKIRVVLKFKTDPTLSHKSYMYKVAISLGWLWKLYLFLMSLTQ